MEKDGAWLPKGFTSLQDFFLRYHTVKAEEKQRNIPESKIASYKIFPMMKTNVSPNKYAPMAKSGLIKPANVFK